MASIMPYEIVEWEKLFWFLKFLIPKMVVKDKDKDRASVGLADVAKAAKSKFKRRSRR